MSDGNLGNAELATQQGGLGGAFRFWALRTQDIGGIGNSDLTPHTQAAGTQITVYFRTGTSGATPPSQADTVILQARLSDGTVLKEFHNGAPPADGTSYTLDFTDTGSAGGAERCGGVELYIRAIFDGVAGDYDIDSQGTVTVGSSSNHHAGLLRSQKKISDIAISAYPAGATFAYGPAGDENLTLTVTHTQPFVADEGQMRIDALDVTAQQAAGTATNVNGTTTTQQFTADNTFDDAAKTYGAEAVPVGNAFITPDSGAVLWTTFVDDGADVEQNGDNVRRQSFYDVDPRIGMGAATLGETIYNRGEATTIDVGLTNARGEALTRSIQFALEDSGGNVQTTLSDTGPNYDIDYTIGAGDTAVADQAGDQWSLRTDQADIDTQPEQAVYAVSSFYFTDVHVQLDATLVTDDFPDDDAGEDDGGVILGDQFSCWVHVEGVRNDGTEIDTTGSAVTFERFDPDGGLFDQLTTDTGPAASNGNRNGWTARITKDPEKPAGQWSYKATVSFNGNSGTDTEAITHITPVASNLETLVRAPVVVAPGSTFRVHWRGEIDDAAAAPEDQPVYKIFKVDGDDNWSEVVGQTEMRNKVDGTATINGAEYYADVTIPAAAGRYVLWTRGQLNGNGIRRRETFYAAAHASVGFLG